MASSREWYRALERSCLFRLLIVGGSEGMVHIRARWGVFDEEVIIHLLESQAPDICGLLCRELPFVSLQTHGLTAGNILISQAPIRYLGNENGELLSHMAVGDCFFGGASHVGMVYGRVAEPEVHSLWGRVEESDRATLIKVGNAIWENLMRPWSQGMGEGKRQHAFVEFSPIDV
jgi:hypothetical protein